MCGWYWFVYVVVGSDFNVVGVFCVVGVVVCNRWMYFFVWWVVDCGWFFCLLLFVVYLLCDGGGWYFWCVFGSCCMDVLCCGIWLFLSVIDDVCWGIGYC